MILEAKHAHNSLYHFWHLTKIKVSLLYEETNQWNRKKYFVGCYAPWLKDGIYAATNISVEILLYIQLYIQIFILVKAAFFLKGIHQSKRAKQDKHFDDTNEKSGNFIIWELF